MGTIVAGEPRELILEPGRAEKHYWRDIWAYRELFAILAWRDVSVRYKQTALGIAWAVVQPFLTMIVFTVVFGRVAKLPTEGTAPYPIMVYAGMLPWYSVLFALERSIQQPGQRRQSDRESLLPTHPCARGRRRGGIGGFRHQLWLALRADDLVSLSAQLAPDFSAGSSSFLPCWPPLDRLCS